MSSNNATTREVNKTYFLSGKHAKDLDIVVFNNEYVPPLANIYECPIILPAIQDNRIANYKSKDFRSQPLRDIALGYALGHGLFYCNIGCPVILSFLTLKFYRTVMIKNDSCNHSKTGKMLYLCRVYLRRQTVYDGRTPIQYSYEACVSG